MLKKNQGHSEDVSNKKFYEILLNKLNDGIYFLDQERKIFFWNQGAEQIAGFKASEVIGKRCSDNILIHVDERGISLCEENCPVKKTLSEGKIHSLEAYLHHKDGYRLPTSIHVIPIHNKELEVIGAVETFCDISPKLLMPQRTQELKRMNLFDSLTETGNKTFLEMHLNSRLDEMHRYRLPFGVLFVDIDHLSTVNETHGTDVGDRILRMVAQTLSNNIRFFDIIGRWGGEEFLVIVLNVDEPKLDFVANKLRLLVEQSNIMVEETQLARVTVSIGVTIAQRIDTVKILMKRAESLMNHSKWLGRNRVSLNFEKEEI